MKTREQILRDALTGGLGTPFIPSETAIQKEMAKRIKAERDAEIFIPIRSDKTSDANELIQIAKDIENRLKNIQNTVDEQNNHLTQTSILKQSSFTKNKKQILSVQDKAIDLKISSPGNSSVKVIADHFRDPKVDMERSDVDISPQSASVGLRRVDRTRANLQWDPNDVGAFNIVTGRDLISSIDINRGSSLNALVDGTSDNWRVDLNLIKGGNIVAEFVVPFMTKRLPTVNRIDLDANTDKPAKLVLYPEKGKEISIGETSRDGDVLSWLFEPKRLRAIKFIFEWNTNSKDPINLSLDDLGVYKDVYHGAGKLVSKSLSTDNNDEINTITLEVNEEIPNNTAINYFVGLDPSISGCFIDHNSAPVNPGYTAVEFSTTTERPDRIDKVYTSDLRRWSHLSGATSYTSWQPVWSPIQPLSKEPSADVPHHVKFDNTATIKYTDKLADGNNYGIEKGYNGQTAGWWRPGVQNDLDGDARTAYPDFCVNGKEFYRVFYWPSGSQPIDGSVFLNGGSQTIGNAISASGHMWSIAERSQPSLLDVTSTILTPDASGIINITTSANVEFDTIKDLRFSDSHDAPFVRGEDYRVYGSGSTLQVDVSEIESINDLFNNPDRTYEVSYTINQSDGIVNSYSFHTTAQVSPKSNSSVQFKRTELLRNIRLVSMDLDGSISNIEVIEDPGGYAQITRKLEAGYTRIQLVSSTQTYTPDEFISFVGDVSTVEIPGGMRNVGTEELLYNSPRFDHSTFSVMPGISGQHWLVVPDPGSESSRVVDNISLGSANKANPSGSFLFHDSASGVQKFYQLSYEQSLREEKRLMFRADFSSEDSVATSKLNSYTLRINDPSRKNSQLQSPGFKEEDRGTV